MLINVGGEKMDCTFSLLFLQFVQQGDSVFFFAVKSLSRSHLSKYKNYINYTIT